MNPNPARANVPLRSATERLEFADGFFHAVGAKTVRESDFYREFELPRDVDKELTDRPYYWLWVEKTNQEVAPTILRLAFTEDALERENQRLKQEAEASLEGKNLSDLERMFFRPPTAELVTLGSFRLEKLYQSLDQRGRFACVQPAHLQSGNLIPWLMYNARLSYRCDLVEEEIVSIGICLTNGQIVDHFYDMICRLQMTPADSEPLLQASEIPIQNALERIHRYLEQKQLARPHQWAEAAMIRLKKELRQVQTYYKSILIDLPEGEKTVAKAEQRRKELELSERIGPTLEFVPHQLALVGLLEPKTHGRQSANHSHFTLPR